MPDFNQLPYSLRSQGDYSNPIEEVTKYFGLLIRRIHLFYNVRAHKLFQNLILKGTISHIVSLSDFFPLTKHLYSILKNTKSNFEFL